MSLNILGISAFYHDSAAVLLRDGEIIAAAQEERFTRKKQDERFPENAVKFCLNTGGIKVNELDAIVFYEKPFTKFNRLLETYLAFPGRGLSSFLLSIPVWLKEKLWLKDVIAEKTGFTGEILFTEHHEAHAASAFFASPFSKAAYLTLDGVGEWTTTSYGRGDENSLFPLAEIKFPHSIGLFYSAITYYTGFKVNSGEYKIMGLAPYGEPKYTDLFYKHLIDVKEDGSVFMNMEYFDYCTGLTMTNERFNRLLGGKPRVPETKLTQKEMDLAASVQKVCEDVVLKSAAQVKRATGEKYLCLAGGVALNCVANGKLLRSNTFDDIWIQPAAGDAGGALGAALAVHYGHFKMNRGNTKRDLMKGAFLGTQYTNEEIRSFLVKNNLPYHFVQNNQDLYKEITAHLTGEKVIGWFSGRMEFGPRALGARSILGDARSAEMQKKMNLKIKFREGFRPFAPVVLADKVSEWFEIDRESPYMLLVADVKKEKQKSMTENEVKLWGIEKLNILRSEIPAVTHIDYSARLQTVNRQDNERYYDLITEFYKQTGCPVLVNTSFNVRGEPIVESPLDAYKCFMRTGLDVLILENFILLKEEQPEFHDTIDWKQEYVLD